ncbi:hypothetical protein VKT23_010854 [Stygiomarasmius scandens]|uniref:Transmembrane protein n=1 Tax=Marasmiellus scandens TaxID=2682957 RepID=A0ABR1JFI7_9AGAR
MSSSSSPITDTPPSQATAEDEQNSQDTVVSEHQVHPSPIKRTLWMIVIGLVLLLAFNSAYSSWARSKRPQVVHAQRYSKEHKFRPAASPIITESLRDGRVRLRGAGPTQSPEPKPTPTTKKTKKRSKGKARRTKRKNSGKPGRNI